MELKTIPLLISWKYIDMVVVIEYAILVLCMACFAKIKKESGESPERSGHCKWKAISKKHWCNTGKVEKAFVSISQETCQSRNALYLPEKGCMGVIYIWPVNFCVHMLCLSLEVRAFLFAKKTGRKVEQ